MRQADPTCAAGALAPIHLTYASRDHSFPYLLNHEHKCHISFACMSQGWEVQVCSHVTRRVAARKSALCVRAMAFVPRRACCVWCLPNFRKT